MLTGTKLATNQAGRLSFRPPVADDAPAIYALVERCQPLDLNSRYCYLILCEHFFSTCVVVQSCDADPSDILACLTAYVPPKQPDTLFVWQVAVDASLRGQGVAKRLLAEVLARQALQGVRFVEATVNPSNDASRNIFKSLARQMNCDISETLLFAESLLSNTGDHEQENLIRVGPFQYQQS